MNKPFEKKVLELRHIDKSYFMAEGLEQKVLKDINFSVSKGEFLAIMGPSGSGKSTLMNILGCLDKPTKGEYLLDGVETSQMNEDELAFIRNRKIGFVFQGFNLMMRRTVEDNVVIPLIYSGKSSKESYLLADEYLKKVNLAGYEKYFPNQLSGGMQQRVAIARAMINTPEIVFADEPTGNLDTKTSHEIMTLFKELNEKGMTIILITHEPDIAKYAKRLIRIQDGQKFYDGSVKGYKED
ncbi:MAG: ABC transporter ATP-binding protein [Alphaproteobacteria bacterium]|nr:ABC transporter ATP-binding protein [Alphaproteobacteria bacterium]